MLSSKPHIIAQLQQQILPLLGYKTNSKPNSFKLGPITHAFPNHCFPVAAVHEFITTNREQSAATAAFIAGLLAKLTQQSGATIYISASRSIFPIALQSFALNPSQFIFIDLQKEKDVIWVMEEALKCKGLAGVVGELQELNFTESRRLQLAVEKSGVTGFIIRKNPRKLVTTACISRWQINPLPGITVDDLPGIGFPRWNVELLKIRNGRPGSWQIEWAAGGFRYIPVRAVMPVQEQQQLTG